MDSPLLFNFIEITERPNTRRSSAWSNSLVLAVEHMGEIGCNGVVFFLMEVFLEDLEGLAQVE